MALGPAYGLGPWRLDLGPLTHIRSITVNNLLYPYKGDNPPTWFQDIEPIEVTEQPVVVDLTPIPEPVIIEEEIEEGRADLQEDILLSTDESTYINPNLRRGTRICKSRNILDLYDMNLPPLGPRINIDVYHNLHVYIHM